MSYSWVCVTIEQVRIDSENLTSHGVIIKVMDKLDQLISKFKEVKEELEKNSPSPLHDTVEGFMGGLKTLPKGSAERGRFITQHMNHGPFLSALNQHPQGKQVHTMLTGHLNSKANAGPKAYGGSVAVAGAPAPLVKSEEDPLEELEKFYISPYTLFGSSKRKQAEKPVEKPASTKPTGIDKIKEVAKEPIRSTSSPSNASKPAATTPRLTGLDRIRAESQKPITATTVKKDEDESEKDEEKVKKSLDEVKKAIHSPSMTSRMMGGGASQLTNPNSMDRANAFHAAMSGAFKPTPAVAPTATPAKKLTGVDRIRAEAARPIAKDEDVEKDDAEKTPVALPKMNAQGKAEASAPKEWQPGQNISGRLMTLLRGDPKQVHHEMNPPKGYGQGKVSPITTAIPKVKPAGAHLPQAGAPEKSASLKFTKTVNSSYEPSANMAMSADEKLTLNKGGQWSLDKAASDEDC